MGAGDITLWGASAAYEEGRVLVGDEFAASVIPIAGVVREECGPGVGQCWKWAVTVLWISR